MAVQQQHKSKMKIRSRKAANRYKGLETNTCPSCGASRLPHRVCRACGVYKDKQVLTVTAD